MVELSEESEKLLRAINAVDVHLIDDTTHGTPSDPARTLLRLGFVEYVYGNPDENGEVPLVGLRISDTGKAFLRYLKTVAHQNRMNNIRAWITLAIAVAAFIKSFFF